jgi:hypothetical protein
MVHEPYLTFGGGTWRQMMAAAVHRVMTAVLLRAASRVWVSIPAWEAMWKPYALGRGVEFSWLPIPTGLSRPPEHEVGRTRGRLTRDSRLLVGHLGTYGSPVASMLHVVLPDLMKTNPDADLVLIGAGSREYRTALAARHPALADRIAATGELEPSALAAHVAACDLLVQPYPDGISSRRTTTMAALRLGVPVLTTRGHLTEGLWDDSRAVRLCDVSRLADMAGCAGELLADRDARTRMASAGRELYDRVFDVARTVAALRQAPAGKAA